MALETLKDVRKIGGSGVVVVENNESCERSSTDFIDVNLDKNSIQFKIQNGPIKEVGVNGCQVDDILIAIRKIVEGLNKQFPCRENSLAITKMEEAEHWLTARTKNRETRGVEGTNQK